MFLITIALVLISSPLNAKSASVPQGKLSKHPVLLVVSFDGFRYDYMSKTDTPALRAIQEEGVSVPFMQAQFPTKTFPNHHSIATGLFPNYHGVTDNVVYDPKFKKKLTGFTDDPEFWNYSPDVIPFWIRNEQGGDGRYSGCFMWAGSNQGYGENSNLFPTHYIPKYNASVPWETRVETVISWMTHETKPANVVFLYHNEPDSRGHSSGTDDEETLTEIRRVDERTAYLVQELKGFGIYDKINLIILSDHGMQTVHKDNVMNTSLMADTKLYYKNGGSPILHIQPKSSSDTTNLYDAFKSASTGKNFSVYKKNEMTKLNYGNYGTNRRIADIVLVADPGFGFEDIDFNERGVHGIHGYDPNSPNMTAIFMARGNLFKKGMKAKTSFQNVDLFPLFSKIMGIPVSPNNGSLEIVSNFLVAKAGAISSNFKMVVSFTWFNLIMRNY